MENNRAVCIYTLIEVLRLAVICLYAINRKHSEDINQNEATKEFFAMDTCITMTAYGVNAEDALTEAADKLSVLEQIWSVTDSGSDIYAINHGSGQPVSVREETAFFQTCKVLDPFHILFKVFYKNLLTGCYNRRIKSIVAIGNDKWIIVQVE